MIRSASVTSECGAESLVLCHDTASRLLDTVDLKCFSIMKISVYR